MNAVAIAIGFTLTMLALVASGTYLVITEHYGWAWIPFVAIFCMRMKT